MSRLIDADALKDEVMKIWSYIQCVTGDDVMDAVMTDIKNATTVDAVRVVRCVDCKHRDAENGLCKGRGWPMQLVPDDGFCDKGERSEDGEVHSSK